MPFKFFYIEPSGVLLPKDDQHFLHHRSLFERKLCELFGDLIHAEKLESRKHLVDRYAAFFDLGKINHIFPE